VDSRLGPFWICPFLFMGFPGLSQGGDCLIPLAGGPVLAVCGVDGRSVIGGVSHPVRRLIPGGWRRRVGSAIRGTVAWRVVLGRAVDPHGPPSLLIESERLQDEL